MNLRPFIPAVLAALVCAPAMAGDIAAPFPTPMELEIDKIGREILAAGIPPAQPSQQPLHWAANFVAMEPEPARLIDNATISSRENTCMDVAAVDTMYFMTFFGTKR